MKLNAALLIVIVFVEGFASLGVEVVALRRLVPFMGSSIMVTAPTIGLFLLALASGYWTGGRIDKDFQREVTKNFLRASLVAGVGLSSVAVQATFAVIANPVLAYLFFMGVVVCPCAYWMAQTVPLLTNLMGRERAGAASGAALTASTAGSFVSAAALSLVVMQWIGVWAAIVACSGSLAFMVVACAPRQWRAWVSGSAMLVTSLLFNVVLQPSGTESAYADYRMVEIKAGQLPEGYITPARAFVVNNQLASVLDGSTPSKRARYIERMQTVLDVELQLEARDVLVLGAGGFSLTAQPKPKNNFVYVDIDPVIKGEAEEGFLKSPVGGEFVVDDARLFVKRTDRKFEAVVVDVFSSHHSIPGHLVTAEFWRSLPRVLKPDGAILINLILDSKLQSPFARNLLVTIEHSLGRCSVDVIDRARPVSNVLVVCRPALPSVPVLYTDEVNRVDLDRGLHGN